MNIENLKTHIKNISEALDFFNQILDQEITIEESNQNQKNLLVEMTELKRLLKQNVWPQAISAELICESSEEDDKLARASEVCKEIFKLNLDDKKILDFGCGEGHSSYLLAALSNAKIVVGFDREPINDQFEALENLTFTQKVEQIKDSGPFDYILAHDVLDHCENPEEIISLIKELKAENGEIFVRCHPWTSRHATHLYQEINKAYIHLIFTEDELYQMGIKPKYAFVCNDPLNYYQQIFRKYNLTVLKEKTINQSFELFFLTKPSILRRLKRNLKVDGKLPIELLEIQFIDYTLC